MTVERARAIVNPRAGLASARAIEAAARARPGGTAVEVCLTRGPGHATELAARAARDGDSLLFVAGGDGTVNEAAAGLLGSATALGIVPVGSGNGLARALRVPLRPQQAFRQLHEGVDRLIDVGLANGRPFVNVAGTGLDARIGLAYHEWGRRGGRRGLVPYFALSAARFVREAATDFTIESPGGTRRTRAFLVAFFNGPQYGGGAVVAPGARLDDGLLEAVVIEAGSRWRLLWNAPRLFLGGIERFGLYRRESMTSCVVSAPGPYHRDGEPEPGTGRLEIAVRTRALVVRVPRATADDPDGPLPPSGAAT